MLEKKKKAQRFSFHTGQQNFQVSVKIKFCVFELDLMKLKFRANTFLFLLISFILMSGIEHGFVFFILGSDLCHWKIYVCFSNWWFYF